MDMTRPLRQSMVSGMRLAVVAVALGLPACGTGSPASLTPADSGTPRHDARAADAPGDVDAARAMDAARLPCSEPRAERPDGGTCVLEAEGQVTDLTDAPLSHLVMTLCGAVCFGTQSDDGGNYVVPVGIFIDTGSYAIHADGRPDHAVDYLRLLPTEPKVIRATMRLPTLPPSAVELPPDGAQASSVTEGDLTLQIAAGTKFELDIEDYGTPTGRILRVAAVPLASAPAYAATAKVDAIYALAPSGATSSLKMGVMLKNSAALPASSAVDVMVLGDDYFSIPPNVGILGVAAAAHVSADGTTIQTDPGEGITKITWLAVRAKGT